MQVQANNDLLSLFAGAGTRRARVCSLHTADIVKLGAQKPLSSREQRRFKARVLHLHRNYKIMIDNVYKDVTDIMRDII